MAGTDALIDALREHSNVMRQVAEALDRHSEAQLALAEEMRLEREPEGGEDVVL